MRVYIAAPWKHKTTAQAVAGAFRHAGHTITSRWLDFQGESCDPAVLKNEAARDWTDVLLSDVLVLLNSELSEGKATEQGIALASNIPILGIGKPERNVFHHLPQYTWVASVDDALATLASLGAIT